MEMEDHVKLFRQNDELGCKELMQTLLLKSAFLNRPLVKVLVIPYYVLHLFFKH